MKKIIAITTLLILAIGSLVSHTDASTISRNQYADYKLTDTQSYLVYLGENKSEYVFLDTSFKEDNIVYVEKSDVATNEYEIIKKLKPKQVCIGEYEDNEKWELKSIKELK